LPIIGGLSLLWFLIRVGPKPSRAAYPCQRAAAPLAASFLAWLAAVGVWMVARRKAVRSFLQARYFQAVMLLAVAAVALLAVLQPLGSGRMWAAVSPSHEAIGVGRGIHPGRVIWVHAPEATDWAGPDSEEHWYDDACTDPGVVDQMMSAGIRSLAGRATDAEAWEALFRNFNERRGNGAEGYQPGQKIAVKLNLVSCWSGYAGVDPFVDPVTREKTSFPNHIDVAPQMVLALLRQLVEEAGVAEEDISVGDTTALWPECYLAPLRAVYPHVHYVENKGGEDRVRAEFSDIPIYWSTTAAEGTRQDYLPKMFAEAGYIIDFAVLKGHSAGVTLCAKNWYGALIRLPNGHLYEEGRLDYYNLHDCLPNKEWAPGMGHYRALVDLMGHPELGGKTLLNLVDGLYGGYYALAEAHRWQSAPFGDGEEGDWPSSLFLSQDPVAIDSVAYDFLLHEWPEVVTGGVNEPGSLEGGQEDYLHEAALADTPPSGTFYDPDGDGVGLASLGVHEHWDSPETKRYGRNLGKERGIELVGIRLPEPPAELSVTVRSSQLVVSWEAGLGFCELLHGNQVTNSEDWSPVVLPVREVVGRTEVRLPITEQQQFFQLCRPAGSFVSEGQ
jgi:hypothetical protein